MPPDFGSGAIFFGSKMVAFLCQIVSQYVCAIPHNVGICQNMAWNIMPAGCIEIDPESLENSASGPFFVSNGSKLVAFSENCYVLDKLMFHLLASLCDV